jgi:hypothetical protein
LHGIPTQRRLNKEPIDFGEKGLPVPTRADDPVDGILAQHNSIRAGDQEKLPVPEGATLAIDLIATTRQRMIEDAIG